MSETTDIVDLIGQDVSLSRTGANYLGLCPFHTEDYPSFIVYVVSQHFRCYGCGRTGNARGYEQMRDGGHRE